MFYSGFWFPPRCFLRRLITRPASLIGAILKLSVNEVLNCLSIGRADYQVRHLSPPPHLQSPSKMADDPWPIQRFSFTGAQVAPPIRVTSRPQLGLQFQLTSGFPQPTKLPFIAMTSAAVKVFLSLTSPATKIWLMTSWNRNLYLQKGAAIFWRQSNFFSRIPAFRSEKWSHR